MKITGLTYKDWTVEFVYSPFFELMCSLHVLFHPAHHKHRHTWAINMSKRLNKKLLNTLSFYDEVSDQFLGAMEFQYLDDVYHDFNPVKGIEALGHLPTDLFVHLLINKTMTQEDIKGYRQSAIQVEGMSDAMHDLLMNPSSYQENFVAALKEYFYLYFQKELLQLEPFLVRSLQAHKGLSQQMDFCEYLSLLHPRIENLSDRLVLHKHKRYDFYHVDIKKVQVSISSFIDPHLLIGEIDGMLSFCIRAKLEKIPDLVHEDLVATLKALGDKTRLKIVKLLYEKPLCTQELAMMIDISEAGVSKHMRLLQKAGLTRKIRRGNYLLYYLEQEVIDRLPLNIYQYLDE